MASWADQLGAEWDRQDAACRRPKTQDCRDCGKPFPYDPDADRCADCIAANTEPTLYPFTVRGGNGGVVGSFTTLEDAENYAALMNSVFSVTVEAVR